MAERIALAQQRLVICRLFLELSRLAAATYIGTDLHGASADELMLLCAVAVGHLEGRPMVAAKIAEYAGITRPSAHRKLLALQARGMVARQEDGAYCLHTEGLNSAPIVRLVRALSSQIKEAANHLSKLDG